MGFLMLILRVIFGYIDAILYQVDAELYGLMIKIASAEVFTDTIIEIVAGRIYQLLGLVMLFKLMSSFLTYIINPEDMLDKTKGFGNIIKTIIISLFLIVITPWAFDQSRLLQHYVIDGQLIEYFVFGRMTSDKEPGYEMMMTVGKVFIHPVDCDGEWEPKSGSYSSSNACEKLYLDTKWNAHLTDIFTNQNDSAEDVADLMNLQTFDLGGFLDWLTYDLADDKIYKMPIVPTLIGITIGYMLIVMCIDIAVRSVKLGFYEIIAPIPIISYVGFKNGKESMLNKWFQQVLKTYADLFTRVAALQIAIFFIKTLTESPTFNDNGIFVNIFLIVGALTFAKQFPNILKEMGINFEAGGFDLKKKLTDDMAGSKLIRRTAAAGVGFAGGMAANALKGGANFVKDRMANHELYKEMRAAGYKGLMTRAKRNEFYKNNESMRGLGSVRHRRDYVGQAAFDNYRQTQADNILNKAEERIQQLEHRKTALENTATQRQTAMNSKKAQLIARGMSESEAIASSEYQQLYEAYKTARRASDDFNAGFDAKSDEIMRKAMEQSDRVRTKKAPLIRGNFAAGRAEDEFTRNHASEFTGGLGSVFAGGVSAATRAATSKDGKIFSGAGEGIRGAVEARDTRDKRQEADYGFGTRIGDSVRSFAGLDTKIKEMEKTNFDELNELQLQISAAQKRYTDAGTDEAARNAAAAEYQKLQAALKKKEKEISALSKVKEKK